KGIVFPYRSLDGELDGFERIRLRNPRDNSHRYHQLRGTTSRAYFPFECLKKLKNGRSPIYITEGEKKALALSQLGLAAIRLRRRLVRMQKGRSRIDRRSTTNRLDESRHLHRVRL